MIVLLVLFCVLSAIVDAQYLDNNKNQHFCADFHPQMIVNFNQILGRWYATEVIFHEKEENERIKYHDVCPIIHLSDILAPAEEFIDNINSRSTIDQRQNTQEENDNLDELMKPLVDLWNTNQNTTKRRWSLAVEQEDLKKFKKQSLKDLRIVWNELGTRDEYCLKYNTTRPGYWMSFGPLNNNSYHDQYKHHFVGTVQVLRAVRTHMILTFCHISHRDKFFSVILTREPWMEIKELHSIHNFLQRKLPIKHVRRMCMDFVQNGGEKARENIAVLILVLAYLRFVNRFS